MSEPALEGPIVVDANILFSALLKDGTTRRLLLHGGLDLHTPGHIWDEFARNRDFLVKKSGATRASFDLLVDALRDRIADVPLPLVQARMDEAQSHLAPKDRLDAPYVAACLALGAMLWTRDKRLKARAPVRVVTTEDVVAALLGPS
jgi:predicted nucleic acid-binding protein